jgi:hypothetical protein
MSARRCQFDQRNAKYVCKIHNVYFCEEHCGQHVSDGMNHITVKLFNILAEKEFEELENQAFSRIEDLEQAKIQVTSNAAHQIAEIGNLCMLSIENPIADQGLDPENQDISKFTALEHEKMKAVINSQRKIAEIGHAYMQSIQTLDKHIGYYKLFLSHNNYDHQGMQNIFRMLNTRLQVNISEHFTVNLYEHPIRKVIDVSKIREPQNKLMRQSIRKIVEEEEEIQPIENSSNTLIRKRRKSSGENSLLYGNKLEEL